MTPRYPKPAAILPSTFGVIALVIAFAMLGLCVWLASGDPTPVFAMEH